MSWRELLGLKPSIDDLAERLLREVQGQQNRTWTYDVQEQVLRSDSGVTINLVNIFREYANAPRAARRELIEKYLSFFSAHEREVPKLWTLAAKGIFAAVRSKYDYMTMEIESRGNVDTEAKPKSDTVTWPLVGDLSVRLLYDFGPNMGHVQRDTLATWGQDEQVVRKQALSNLRSLQKPRWEQLANGVHKIVSEVGYEESWFLIDTVIEQLPFAATAVVMPVNRGVLLAADSNSAESLSAMLHEALRSLQENPWPMSGTMLKCINGEWQQYVAEGRNAQRAHTLNSVNLAALYNDQQTALQKYFSGIEDDVYVASMELRQTGDDIADVQSWCSWSQGVRALLPKTDVIILGRGEPPNTSEVLVVLWDKAMEVCAHYLQASEEDPPRFHVSEFPNADEWQRLTIVGELLPGN